MITSKTEILSQDVAKHYNELDHLYREIWGQHLHHGLWKNPTLSTDEAIRELSLEVAKTLGLKAGDQVCDVGCGYGGTSRIFAEQFKAKVTGLTISKSQYDFITQNTQTGDSLKFFFMDWMKNDLADQSFDHVFSIESSEHMPDKKRFFSEAHRVLKPQGSLVICAWLANDHPSSRDIKYLLEPVCREGRLPGLASEKEYREFYKNAGFSGVEFVDYTDQVKKTWTLAIGKTILYFATHPRDLKLIFKNFNTNADFLKSLLRIRWAYETKAMRYGIFKGIC